MGFFPTISVCIFRVYRFIFEKYTNKARFHTFRKIMEVFMASEDFLPWEPLHPEGFHAKAHTEHVASFRLPSASHSKNRLHGWRHLRLLTYLVCKNAYN